MKQPVAILLLLVYLFTGTTLQQLQRAPVLLEHYQEHKAMTPHISIAGFLSMHYLSGAVKDADYARDMQLPYKSADQVSAPGPVVFIPPVLTELTLREPQFSLGPFPIPNDVGNPVKVAGSIWQPPKHC
ncbi:hypothetical protein [Pontibacter mangrovi]|uniref:Uncharacterized protein n=1 Tax=Pontibacter mangrovi TaxID=2589816 RepID=A0A501WC06_9BACT|nr:hypothetical protein [Pontibacter mangrovi]TPE43026.1 hypothetical protein FJM65_15390 [Pontibacter mangrovi]